MNAFAPIGVFDSGLGGLTAVAELKRILPGEDIVYFGDTGRVPYGSKDPAVIINYAKQDLALLLSKGVKTIVAACGTVSSTLPPAVSSALPVPYTGVVGASARAAARATKTGRIGIIGTEATIASGSYQEALRAESDALYCVASACPLFVPLVENGHFTPGDALATLAVEQYLAPVRKKDVDTLIAGCTHYPLLADIIRGYMGPGVTLIDAGRETALALRETLGASGLLNPRESGGRARYYVTDDPARFDRFAKLFMGDTGGGPVEWVDIEKYRL